MIDVDDAVQRSNGMFLVVARVCLALDALIFAMVGVFLFTDPASLPYLDTDSASGLTAIRTWGGMFFGVGITGLIAAIYKEWVTPGLVMLLIIGSLIVVARVYGIAVDGLEARQTSELQAESLGPLLAIIGLIFCRLQKSRP